MPADRIYSSGSAGQKIEGTVDVIVVPYATRIKSYVAKFYNPTGSTIIFTQPSMWNIIVSTIAFSIVA